MSNKILQKSSLSVRLLTPEEQIIIAGVHEATTKEGNRPHAFLVINISSLSSTHKYAAVPLRSSIPVKNSKRFGLFVYPDGNHEVTKKDTQGVMSTIECVKCMDYTKLFFTNSNTSGLSTLVTESDEISYYKENSNKIRADITAYVKKYIELVSNLDSLTKGQKTTLYKRYRFSTLPDFHSVLGINNTTKNEVISLFNRIND